MKPLKKFEEYLEIGIVNKRSSDRYRADSLVLEAEKRRRFVEKMTERLGIDDENANYFIENTYDILIELIRARMLFDGFHASGEGAHEAEVSYMRKLGFSESDARFMNDLRYFRNSIHYYGKHFDSEYAHKVLSFMKRIYPELKKLD